MFNQILTLCNVYALGMLQGIPYVLAFIFLFVLKFLIKNKGKRWLMEAKNYKKTKPEWNKVFYI